MEQEKQEIIAKLYALRGGLSVMSELYDEAAKVNEEINDSNAHIDMLVNNAPLWASDEEANEKIEYLDRISSVVKLIGSIQGAMHRLRSTRRKIRFKIFIRPILFVLGAVLCYSYYRYSLTRDEYFFSWLASVGLIVTGIGSIINIFRAPFSIGDLIDKQKLYREAKDDLRKRKKQHNELLQEKDKVFAELEQAKNDKLKEITATVDTEKENIERNGEIQQAIIMRFHAAHEAVQAEFGSLLDERDWGNVDLIIFNYETGRALDMRDALIQVDNERRNERLVKAVRDASKSISASIGRSFGALQSSINAHFTRLDNTIANFSGQISNVAEKSLLQSQSLGRQLEKIAESSSAQQALLAKANTSSDELAASVERIRMIENDRYYGIH